MSTHGNIETQEHPAAPLKYGSARHCQEHIPAWSWHYCKSCNIRCSCVFCDFGRRSSHLIHDIAFNKYRSLQRFSTYKVHQNYDYTTIHGIFHRNLDPPSITRLTLQGSTYIRQGLHNIALSPSHTHIAEARYRRVAQREALTSVCTH